MDISITSEVFFIPLCNPFFSLLPIRRQPLICFLSLYISGLNGGLPKDMSTWNLWMWPYLEDVIRLRIGKWAHPSLGWALNPMTSVLIRKREDIGRRRWWNGVRNWSDSSTSQGLSSTAGSHQKLGKRNRTVTSSELTEGTNPTNTLILGFWPSDCYRINFCCFKLPSLW